ncbi:MAG: response regulator [Deltaproteobacteria bacterium]|nr:response regulator [Deltaproteobacteria bacterium]
MKDMRPILLVEDDEVDTMTVKRSLKDLHVHNSLITVSNGEEALDYLRDEQHQRPCIILLDINMPKMNGIEFLTVAKNDDKLKKIPVIVLTTSKEEQDKLDSFELGVAGYMIKPCTYEKFLELLRTINGYWTVSELPNGI